MKILQLLGFYPPVIGGIEAYAKELCEHLVKKGHKVTVIARYHIGIKPIKTKETINGVKVIWVYSSKNTKFSTLFAWIKVFFIAMKQDFDIIHAHTIVPINIVGNLLKIIRHKPLVCTIHETNFQQGINNPLYRFIAKLSLNNADYVYGISDDICKKANSIKLNKLVTTSKNAVNLKTFKKIGSSIIRKKHHLSQETKIIITTRRLVEKNGVIYLVRSIPYVLKKHRVFLYLIGKGPERETIDKEISKLKIENNVFINSSVETEELVSYLSDADIFALPSLIEGMSMSAMEAMACELPLVATKVGGNPQFVSEGINGFLCLPANPIDLADKLIKAIETNPTELGKNGRKRVESEFDWEDRINELIQIYTKQLTK
jgi:glycosyltransferase involved in cell wall biosynthesis